MTSKLERERERGHKECQFGIELIDENRSLGKVEESFRMSCLFPEWGATQFQLIGDPRLIHLQSCPDLRTNVWRLNVRTFERLAVLKSRDLALAPVWPDDGIKKLPNFVQKVAKSVLHETWII